MGVAKVRQNPRLTFSALAEYLQATPYRQLQILRDQKFPKEHMVKSYDGACQKLCDWAVLKKPLNCLGLEPHEVDVVTLATDNGWSTPHTASHPDVNQQKFVLKTVVLSVFPDIQVLSAKGKSGAIKFYFPKRKMNVATGTTMASLLCHYRRTVLELDCTSPDLCMVYDVRGDVHHYAGKSYTRLLSNAEAACEQISMMWPSLAP